jgi:branched-chain amino acid transport system substrate-binding protein
VNNPSAQKFTDAFTKRWGKPPENQAWGDYLSVKVLAQAMAETKSTDSAALVKHLESGAKFDVLKSREGYFRNWDHQLIAEMYSIRPKPKNQQKDKWDILLVGPPVPGKDQDPELIAPTREENACTFA